MVDNSSLTYIKSNKKIFEKILLNKKWYYSFILFQLFQISIFITIGAVCLSVNDKLIKCGFALIILGFISVIETFFLSYFLKKNKNNLKSHFSLDKVIGFNLWMNKVIDSINETELFDRNFLDKYLPYFSEWRELKWHTKTYDLTNFEKNNNLLLRASYIIDYGEKWFFLNSNKYTQLYFCLNTKIKNNIEIYSKENNDLNSSINTKKNKIIINNHIFYAQKDIDKKEIKTIIKLIDFLKSHNYDYMILIADTKINIYLLVKNNYLFINLEELNQLTTDKLDYDVHQMNELIQFFFTL